MNGPHDLGGRDGFGPIAPEQDEPLFHGDWEKRAMAVTLAAGAMGHWTIDESRHAREDDGHVPRAHIRPPAAACYERREKGRAQSDGQAILQRDA